MPSRCHAEEGVLLAKEERPRTAWMINEGRGTESEWIRRHRCFLVTEKGY